MAQKSRELSQFGSFLEVDNTNKNIGITTTSNTPYIGIGTTNPTSKLHVVGNTYVSGSVGIATTSPTATLDVIGSIKVGTARTYTTIGNDFGRNIEIGVGSTTLDTYVDFQGSATYTDYAARLLRTTGDNSNFNIINRGTGSIRITTQDAGNIDFTTNNTFRHRIDSNGVFLVGSATSTGTTSQSLQVNSGGYFSDSVGIGTTNPSYKLHVVGDTNISGFVSATNYYLNGNLLVNAAVQTWEISGSNIYRNTGNVGIGSTTPTEKLDVIGNIKSTGNVTTNNINASGIITASIFNSTVAQGTAPLIVTSDTQVTNLNASFLRGKIPPGSDIVGISDIQTLTNKTINLSNNTLSGTRSQFNSALSDDDFATLTGSETLTNKTLTSPVISSISNSGTQTVPTGTGTLVSTNSVGIITTGMIADLTITNNDISPTASIAITKLSSSTISGVSLGSTLANLTAGSFVSYSSGTTYNGSTAITVSVAATTVNNGNTIVSRDSSGDFTAGTISASGFNLTLSGYRVNGTTVLDINRNLINVVNGSFSGIVTCTDLNSTSDINLKDNIQTINNALTTVNSLRGVTFDWKENGRQSIGVIAQELENVLPELVNHGEYKSVNYNGLIGVLIEAVKELSNEVQNLKLQLNK